ncbi:MAG: hypothetical protein JWO86_2337, partial [Myxococcaceae bacterium]|nr:hypothetical protein [Myxococcaceae bacterium]
MKRCPLFTRFSRDLMTLAALAVPVLVAMVPRTAQADEPAPASVAPAVAPIGPTAPPAAAAATTGTAVVQLDADDQRATIERRVGTQSPSGMPLLETGLFSVGQWEHACVAPCTLKLDTRYAYRVAGDGLVPTDSFSLPHDADRVRVDAKMGSSTGRVAGVLMTGAGILAVAAGGVALIASPILASEDVGSQGFRTGVLAGGVGALSVGIIAIGVGTILWLTNGSTAH